MGSVWRGRRDRRKPPKEQRKIIKFNHLLTNCLIFCTDSGNAASDLVGGGFIHAPHMSPDLLVAVFSLDRLPRLPLFLRNPLHVPIAVLIKPLIGDKDGFDDPIILAHGNYREILDVEVDCHRHQIRITLTLPDLFGLDLFGLADVQFRRCVTQDQLWTLLLPTWLCSTLLKEPVVLDGIVDPGPGRSRVDLESHKRLPQIESVQFQAKSSFVESWMVAGSRQPWLAPLFACLMPIGEIREIRSNFANRIFDHGPAITAILISSSPSHHRKLFSHPNYEENLLVLYRQ